MLKFNDKPASLLQIGIRLKNPPKVGVRGRCWGLKMSLLHYFGRNLDSVRGHETHGQDRLGSCKPQLARKTTVDSEDSRSETLE